MESFKENYLSVKSWRVILALVAINIIIILLKSFNLNTYIILIGFRCHISFILPLILIFNKSFLTYIKKSFLNPQYKKTMVFLVLILLPFLVESGYLFFTHNIDLADPDYFYEFGVSSVADYPVYLIWNFPQIVLLFLFLTAVSSISKYKFITVFLSIIFLFGSELIPINQSPIHLFRIGNIVILFCYIFYFNKLL